MKKIDLIRAIRILNHVRILDEHESYKLIEEIIDLKEGSLSVGRR